MGGLFSKKKKPEEGGSGASEKSKSTAAPAQPEAKAAEPKKEKEPEKAVAADDDEEEPAASAPGPDLSERKGAHDQSGGEEAYSFWDRNRTFKPQKQIMNKNGKKLQNTMKATMKATLGGLELKKTVQLPPGEDLNEWIAVNTVHFYNAANMIYGTIAEYCTEDSCKTMSAGRNEYLWKDDVRYKKPTRVAAPIYIDLLLNWVNEQISDPTLFPVDEDSRFPRNFMAKVKDIYKRLFRLYAHIYYSHFDKIRDIGANAHLNTCFKHFIYFILEFNLVDQKGLAPLENFIAKFRDQ
jgi:MOB kinase activator 1